MICMNNNWHRGCELKICIRFPFNLIPNLEWHVKSRAALEPVLPLHGAHHEGHRQHPRSHDGIPARHNLQCKRDNAHMLQCFMINYEYANKDI